MSKQSTFTGREDHLKRLPPEYYQGAAIVHWSHPIKDRRRGWLTPEFHQRFREVLIHTLFRGGLCCPIYCCMPDHIHLLWVGLLSNCDQRKSLKYFRRHLNRILAESGYEFQHQAYDHVLSKEESEGKAFESVAEYIARNPERAGIVPPDHFHEYPFLDCVLPGYPEIEFRQKDVWERYDKIGSHLRKNGPAPTVLRP